MTTVFRLNFNANQYEPISEFTAEWREQWLKGVLSNLADYEIEWLERKAKHDAQVKRRLFLDDLHAHYCKISGTDNRHTMSVAQAKHYVRARASDNLQDAFEFLEDALKGKIAVNLKDRIDIAYEVVKRAAGSATVMNAVPNVQALTELPPVDAIDSVMKAYAAGVVDEKFVSTLLGLLGAKINGLRVEEAGAKKSAAKVGDRIQKPPPGKVV